MPSELIIGYIVRDEAEMLRLTLPKLQPFVDGIVAIDADSKDGTRDVLRDYGAHVRQRAWDGVFSNARNACIELGEETYPDAHMLMLDGDEALTAGDLLRLRSALSELSPEISVTFPRYEFVDDFYHFNPSFYPDYQCRCFKLGVGYHYAGIIHEQLVFRDEPKTAFQMNRCVPVPYIHIFHYGKCKSPESLWIKYENYRRISTGEPLLTEIPQGVEIPKSFSSGQRLFFHGERPI